MLTFSLKLRSKYTRLFDDSFLLKNLTQSGTRHSFTQTLPRVISSNFRSSVRNCLAQSSVKLYLMLFVVPLEINSSTVAPIMQRMCFVQKIDVYKKQEILYYAAKKLEINCCTIKTACTFAFYSCS